MTTEGGKEGRKREVTTEGQGLSLSVPTSGWIHSHLSIAEVSGLCDDLLEQHGDIICGREKHGGQW